jgi:beta-mannosidase
MNPLTVSVSRKVPSWTARPADPLWKRDTGHINPTLGAQDVEFDVWVSNSRLREVEGRVVVRFVSVDSGKEVRERMEVDVLVGGNGCTEVGVGWKSGHDVSVGYIVVHVSLWVNGKQVGSDVSWPEPIKYLDFEDRGVEVRDVGEGAVEVSADKPVKGFVFAERPGLKVSDNGFDLIPGEVPTRIQMEGNEDGIPEWTYVGQHM